jgi:hypothetical protein
LDQVTVPATEGCDVEEEEEMAIVSNRREEPLYQNGNIYAESGLYSGLYIIIIITCIILILLQVNTDFCPIIYSFDLYQQWLVISGYLSGQYNSPGN